MKDKEIVVCVVGLGYVGLPLALAFGRSPIKTIGFDVDAHRIKDLRRHVDGSGEHTKAELSSSNATYTDNPSDIAKANFIVIAVPTPVTRVSQPDLSYIESASELVGRNLRSGSIVVYESTVYPGVTEDVCVPILEQASGLKGEVDFKVGYSPERINPGDKEHTLEKVTKIVSGMDKESTATIAKTYGTICKAGVFVAKSIKVAEATKVIENTQRDVNIALVNELSLIFHRIGIDTHDVMEAAGTKWNALNFKPGLVGGHCIGVDPYYLVYKAEELGIHPEVITAARRVNDYMADFVAEETIKGLIQANKEVRQAKILVVGLTFKENVKDIRNSKIATTIDKLGQFDMEMSGFDPMLTKKEIEGEFPIKGLLNLDTADRFDAIIVATPHRALQKFEKQIVALAKKPAVIIDVKRFFPHLQSQPDVIYKCL